MSPFLEVFKPFHLLCMTSLLIFPYIEQTNREIKGPPCLRPIPGKSGELLSIPQHGEIGRGNTTHHEIYPVVIKFKISKSILNERPRNSIISFIKVNSENHSPIFTFFTSKSMNNLLIDNDIIRGLSARNETSLMGLTRSLKV